MTARVERIPACTVSYCPHPRDPDWHECWCGSKEIEHHHVESRGMGGSKIKRDVVALCHKHHEAVTLHECLDIVTVFPWGKTYSYMDTNGDVLHTRTLGEEVMPDAKLRPPTQLDQRVEEGVEAGLGEAGSAAAGASAPRDSGPSGGPRKPEASAAAPSASPIATSRSEKRRLTAQGAEFVDQSPASPPGPAAESDSRPVPTLASAAEPGLPGKITETGWEPPQRPLSDEQVVAVIAEFRREVKHRQWRHGDFANYLVATRGEEAWQFLDGFGYDGSRLMRVMTVCQVFPVSRRREKLSFSHYDTVYALDAESREAWLDRAENEGWDRKELRAAIREDSTPPPAAPPLGQFSTIVVDPPWPYGSRAEDETHRARNPYPDMPLDDMERLEIPAADDCVLWLWTTNAFMHDAFHVLEAWGFEPKTVLTWGKDRMGLGDWLRGQTEHCILAVKGSPRVTLTNQTTLLRGPMREHSRKPDEFYALVEALCPGPRLEMFARQERNGWETHGNETDKFPGD